MARHTKFKDFYPFYVNQHSNPWCRLFHITGTILSFIWIAVAVYFGKFLWIPFALVIGLGFSWIGHFVFEGNHPVSFKQPFFSLLGDFRMCFETLFRRRP